MPKYVFVKQIMVKCSRCKGCGEVVLTGECLDTYQDLSRYFGEITAADFAEMVGIKATAMNNRLSRLEELGLVTSRRYGQKRLFKVSSNVRKR